MDSSPWKSKVRHGHGPWCRSILIFKPRARWPRFVGDIIDWCHHVGAARPKYGRFQWQTSFPTDFLAFSMTNRDSRVTWHRSQWFFSILNDKSMFPYDFSTFPMISAFPIIFFSPTSYSIQAIELPDYFNVVVHLQLHSSSWLSLVLHQRPS